MADIPIEWITSLQKKLDATDTKIDELGIHFDNSLQDVNKQLHTIELAIKDNWSDTKDTVASCRHVKNNELQTLSNNAHLAKEERVRDLTKVKEDFNAKIVGVEKDTARQFSKLTLLTNANKLKIGIYAGIGSAIFYLLIRLLGM